MTEAINDNETVSAPMLTISDLARGLGISEDDMLKRIAKTLSKRVVPVDIVEVKDAG